MQNCGLVNDYKVIVNDNKQVKHYTAYCNGCDKYIKHIAYDEPKFYFGKHKGVLIKDCTDKQYIVWAL